MVFRGGNKGVPLHFLLCNKSKIEKKKKKRNINNDLAILPSHDTYPLQNSLVTT